MPCVRELPSQSGPWTGNRNVLCHLFLSPRLVRILFSECFNTFLVWPLLPPIKSLPDVPPLSSLSFDHTHANRNKATSFFLHWQCTYPPSRPWEHVQRARVNDKQEASSCHLCMWRRTNHKSPCAPGRRKSNNSKLQTLLSNNS